MIKKNFNLKFKSVHFRKGMTYVELIVVLTIFSIMSAVVIFDYNSFQSRIVIKNLSNDIALKIGEAQKNAMSGKLPPLDQQNFLKENGIIDWRPSYGVYFNIGELRIDTGQSGQEAQKGGADVGGVGAGTEQPPQVGREGGGDDVGIGGIDTKYSQTSFIYFADLLNTGICDDTCSSRSGDGDYLNTFSLPKNDVISGLSIYYQDKPDAAIRQGNLAFTFTRSRPEVVFASNGSILPNVLYAEIRVSSTKSSSNSLIKVYSSGRIQIN